jgi:glutathione synthase/RimK-type ligase-like ATP-grasp enzyme
MHQEGRDIRICLLPEEALALKAQGYSYFSLFIPKRSEYRVWVYRRQVLDVYLKTLSRPREYNRFGVHWGNGYTLERVEDGKVPPALKDLAASAVTALELDFGGVDILCGCDGEYYLLEVNAAPGVDMPSRICVQHIAEKIARWVELDYPKRRRE